MVSVSFDGGPDQELRLVVLAVANCRYFGGGMHVAPAADPFDGALDVITVSHGGRWRLLTRLHRIYSGTHLTLPEVGHRRARTVRAVAVDGEVMLDLDGEQPGKLPVTFRILPQALEVCVP